MADRDDTRSGQGVKAYPRGKSQGGRALQAVASNMQENDGSSGYRTVMRETPEGRAIGRTRDGMPMVEVEQYGEHPYMETGRLEYTSPGPLNPSRLLPAKWRFMDIATNGDYLGEIYTGAIMDDGSVGEQVDPQPIPVTDPNPGTLRDDIDSLAIGYERSSNPAKDAEIAEKLEAKTVLKKMIVGNFPSSLWTGLMRLFVQSQYGGAEDSSSWRFIIEMSGDSMYLRYSYLEKDIRYQMSMGMWAHSTPGIFAASDGTFWCINITRPTGSLYRVYACQVIGDEDFVDDLVEEYKRLKTTGASDETLSKVMGYIFAHSKIDLKNMREIGTYDAGTDAGAIAYGWKFNDDGSKASIVVVKEHGESPDEHLVSTTIHMEISYTPIPDQKPSTYFLSASGTHENSMDWVDPWIEGNHIWVPEYETGIRLMAYSIAAGNFGIRPNCEYSNVPIYGYYKDNVWKPATIGRSFHGAEYRQWSTGLEFGGIEPSFIAAHDNYFYGTHLAGTGFSYESISSSWGSKTPLSFDGYSHEATLDNGTTTVVTCSPGELGPAGSDEISMGIGGVFQTGGGPRNTNPSSAPGFSEANARDGYYPINFSLGTPFIATQRLDYSISRTVKNGAVYKAWAFVVPSFDAAAVYIAKSEFDSSSSGTTTTKTMSNKIGRYLAREVNYAGGTGAVHTVQPWQSGTVTGEELAIADGDYAVNDYVSVSSINELKCFNTELSGATGTPTVSFASLFTPLLAYQFIDAGMTMTTSFNGRYKGSEGIEQPNNQTGGNLVPNFVGWA